MTDSGVWRRVCADTSAVVLAGGKSRRIGRPKAFLDLGGRTIIERILDVVSDLFPETLLVTPEFTLFERFHLPLVADRHVGAGALGGTFAGIAAASHPRCLVVACDMPFLQKAVLARLVEASRGRDGAVPRGPDGLHPLHAVYTKDCAGVFERAIEAGTLKLMDAMAGLDLAEIGADELRRLDPALLSLFNVNRLEDLARARELVAETDLRADRTGERG